MSERIDLDAATQAAWAGFRGRLADHVAQMADDDVLIVEVDEPVDELGDDEEGGSAPYVQLCAFGGELVQAEAASNHFLDESCALSDQDEKTLAELGWDAPLDGEEGWDNYHLTFERRRADEVAVLLVRTLREVYAVPHPAFVTAGGLEVDPDGWSGPALDHEAEPADEEDLEGLPSGADHLSAMVDAAMREVFPDLKHDGDGDIPIIAGSSVVFVRVLESRPSVELFAEIVIGPERLDRLAQEMVLLNDAHPLWKFAVRDDRVVMRHEHPALPFSAFGLRVLVKRFVDEVDQVAADLAARVGGRRFLESETHEDERDVLFEGLLEVLHLERVRPATVAGLFDHDRLELIRQIVRIRNGQQSCGDLDQDVVLTALRKALRWVSDGEPSPTRLPPKPRRVSVQEPLLDAGQGLGCEESLDLGWSA